MQVDGFWKVYVGSIVGGGLGSGIMLLSLHLGKSLASSLALGIILIVVVNIFVFCYRPIMRILCPWEERFQKENHD